RAFTAVEVPASDEAILADPTRAGGWKRWALGAAVLAALGVGAFRFFPVDEDVIRAGGEDTAARTDDEAGGLPVPREDARTGLLPGISEPGADNDTEGLSAYLANANQQLRDGRLLSPPNANAWDSL